MGVDTEKNDSDHLEHPHEAQAQLANLGNQEEHELGKWESLRKYPKASFWCVYAVWCVLVLSFENQAGGSILSIPEFRKDFGHFYNGDYVLDTKWQSAFNGAPVASAVVGALGSGNLADWLGRKTSIMICLAVSFVGITLEFVATTNEVFFAGKFVNGFPIGALASITVTYIGEITPLALRGLFTCLTGLSYTLGPLVAALIINETGTYNNRWAYRAVFCAQYGFAAIAAVLIWFMPESPWYLAIKGKDDQALKSLTKLGHPGDEGRVRLAVIHQTLDQVKSETAGASYLECFRKSNLRRTIISVSPLCIQSLSGITFAASYSTYYMQLAGYSTAESFKLQIVQQVISLIGNVMSWYLVDRVGRRSLTVYGLAVLTVILLVTGGLALPGTLATNKGTVALILLYCWWYNVTIGATAYTILAEVSTSRLRIKTIAIGLALQKALETMWNFVLPYLFNPDQLNLGAKLAFIFGGLAVISLVHLWFNLPETAGRTYEELDEMFMKEVPSRSFKKYVPEATVRGQAVKTALDKEQDL
ncbi:Maltose permease MAL31-like protein 2 [Colletotrichum truncatum]|uniref:Maltose permease MAL31-like protein 2 n=1 Tax=Colletotrichum truncatum TaxID=5467 RepID=A0ACC3YPP6_COLTU|nr:Maltose permease MAL31-like protein 2 [Colletotrichum truncatum]KAF6796873.1 Maltose permease MAL31-like protein 2 [Colletotrichum truncatum]